jgi:LysM repeat protein
MRYATSILMAACLLLVAFSSAQAEDGSYFEAYKVKSGDSLKRIAEKYGTTVESIVEMNSIQNPDIIYIGDLLLVPVGDANQKEVVKKETEKYREYVVKRGDTVYGISKRFKVSQKRLVEINNIADPSLIRIGREIRIPSDRMPPETSEKERPVQASKKKQEAFYWKNPGANPFTDEPRNVVHLRRALELFGFSSSEATEVAEEFELTSPRKSYLQRGDKLLKMAFGKNRVEGPVICAFEGKEPVHFYTTPTLDKAGYALVVPEACGNYSLIKSESKPAPKPQKRISKTPPPPKEAHPFPAVPAHPGVPDKEEERLEVNKFEAYMGGGIDEPVHASGHNEHIWAKARYYPLWTKAGSLDLGLGIFGYGALGSGRDRDYSHDWRRWSIGPSLKVVGNHWDADLDLGVGAIYSDGEEGRYESEQKDKIYHVSAHSSFYKRRNEGKNWFPETSVGADVTVPYKTDHDHSWDGNELEPNPWDNQHIEFSLKQGIYDFDLNGFRLTPEIHAGVGHSWGEEADFYKIGPAVSAGYEGYDVLTVSALNYQEYLGSDADNLQWFGLTLDVGNAYRAWKASRIEKVD